MWRALVVALAPRLRTSALTLPELLPIALSVFLLFPFLRSMFSLCLRAALEDFNT